MDNEDFTLWLLSGYYGVLALIMKSIWNLNNIIIKNWS